MEEKYNYYDYLRYELFEVLIPQLLYKGTDEEQNEFFHLLLQENKHLIRNMFRTMCEDDGVSYPYLDVDFETEMFERGGVNILQMSLPPSDPEISSVLRAYLLYTRRKNGRLIKKYFVIKRFDDGNVFNLYITPDIEGLLGEEFTEHIGDMEYEYWRLVREFAAMMIRDMRTGGRRSKGRKKGKGGQDRQDAPKDVQGCGEEGINPDEKINLEQFVEYLQRLQKKDPGKRDE